jgi:precorrin-2 dehydrogenase/sirohydrochlorin ferrochelatase
MRKKRTLLKYYPIAVRLYKKLVLVIGGGKVAERKVKSLLEAGASIRIISPTVTPGLKRLAEKKQIRWLRRSVRKTDISSAYIIVAATDNSVINKDISRWAKRHRIWTNIVDQSVLCSFVSPAVFRSGDAIVAVYTDGKDPVLSRDIKNFLKEHWDDFLSYRNRL